MPRDWKAHWQEKEKFLIEGFMAAMERDGPGSEEFEQEAIRHAKKIIAGEKLIMLDKALGIHHGW